jgi:hypothetical protein
MFVGRAYQHLFLAPPYRAVLWSQGLMEPWVATFLGMDWNTYASSLEINAGITAGIRLVGVLYLGFAAVTLLANPNRRWARAGLWIGAAFVVVLAAVTARDRMLRAVEFFELAIQFTAPVALAVLTRVPRPDFAEWRAPIRALKVAVGVAFAAHGLYAVGFYPVPVEWMTMVTNFLGTDENVAQSALRVAGVLDFAVAALLAVPGADRWALGYAAVWGALTALARPMTMVPADSVTEGLRFWFPEFLVRVPHAAVPAALFLILALRGTSLSRKVVPCGLLQPNHKPC